MNRNVLLSYTKNNNINKMARKREYLEKKVIFQHEEKYYIYFSSIPDEFHEID